MIYCKEPFLFKAVKEYKFNKKYFSPQNAPHTAKLCFSVALIHFWGNSLKTYLFSQKSDYLRKSSEILRMFVFLTNFEKGQSRRKFGFIVNNPFVQSSKMGQILTKTVFLQKMRHIPPNYVFCCFEVFWGKFTENLLLVKNVTISERCSEILRN